MSWPKDVETVRAALEGLRRIEPADTHRSAEECELALLDHVHDVVEEMLEQHGRAGRKMTCRWHGETPAEQLEMKLVASLGGGRGSHLRVSLRCADDSQPKWHTWSHGLHNLEVSKEQEGYLGEVAQAVSEALSSEQGSGLRRAAVAAQLRLDSKAHISLAIDQLGEALALQVERCAVEGSMGAQEVALVEALLADHDQQLMDGNTPVVLEQVLGMVKALELDGESPRDGEDVAGDEEPLW